MGKSMCFFILCSVVIFGSWKGTLALRYLYTIESRETVIHHFHVAYPTYLSLCSGGAVIANYLISREEYHHFFVEQKALTMH